jgi:hypothetical protein
VRPGGAWRCTHLLRPALPISLSVRRIQGSGEEVRKEGLHVLG